MAPKKKEHVIKPLTNKQIEHLAGEALARPSKLTAGQVRQMGGALLERTRKSKA